MDIRVLVEAIAVTTQEKLSALERIWEEMKYDPQAIEIRVNVVLATISDSFDQLLNEQHETLNGVLLAIIDHDNEIQIACKKLGIPYIDDKAPGCLFTVEEDLSDKVRNLNAEVDLRLDEIGYLKDTNENFCQFLDEVPFHVSIIDVPSNDTLSKIKQHNDDLKELAFRREAVIGEKLLMIEQLCVELFIEPCNYLKHINSDVLTADNIARIEGMIVQLENDISDRVALVVSKKSEIGLLYSKLSLPEEDMEHLCRSLKEISPDTLRQLNKELERLHALKRQNVEAFIIKSREELSQLWRSVGYSAEQRYKFRPFYSTDHNEEVLTLHENEVQKLKSYYEENKQLFELIEKHKQMWILNVELCNAAKDPQRLFNTRGNSLLKEEAERRRVRKELPRLTGLVRDMIICYEEANQESFLLNGVPYKEYQEQQEAEFFSRGMREKETRQAARKQLNIEETIYGSRPSFRKRKNEATPCRAETKRIRHQTTSSTTTISSASSSTIHRSNLAPSRLRATASSKTVNATNGRNNRRRSRSTPNITSRYQATVTPMERSVIRGGNTRRKPMTNSVESNGAASNFLGINPGDILSSTKTDISLRSHKTGPCTPMRTPLTTRNYSLFKTPSAAVTRSARKSTATKKRPFVV